MYYGFQAGVGGDDLKLRLNTTRGDLGGMLQWENGNYGFQLSTSTGTCLCLCGAGDAEPFRALLNHPGIAPTLETVLGKHYRMDHSPGDYGFQLSTPTGTYSYLCILCYIGLMTCDNGDDGHSLHGGNYEAFGNGGTLYSYTFNVRNQLSTSTGTNYWPCLIAVNCLPPVELTIGSKYINAVNNLHQSYK